jgi:hypothetical protein
MSTQQQPQGQQHAAAIHHLRQTPPQGWSPHAPSPRPGCSAATPPAAAVGWARCGSSAAALRAWGTPTVRSLRSAAPVPCMTIFEILCNMMTAGVLADQCTSSDAPPAEGRLGSVPPLCVLASTSALSSCVITSDPPRKPAVPGHTGSADRPWSRRLFHHCLSALPWRLSIIRPSAGHNQGWAARPCAPSVRRWPRSRSSPPS